MLLPIYYHKLLLGKIYACHLRKLDLAVRKFVRELLHLPQDVPSSAFHASVKHGGKGIPCLSWIMPVMAIHRFPLESERIKKIQIAPDGSRVSTKSKVQSHFRRDLVYCCDGLRQANSVLITNTWLSDGTSLLSGRDFISAIYIRYNCLYHKSRASRRRDVYLRCSRGWHLTETHNHISQKCFSTYGLRIKRYDALCNYVRRYLEQKGHSVHSELIFNVNYMK